MPLSCKKRQVLDRQTSGLLWCSGQTRSHLVSEVGSQCSRPDRVCLGEIFFCLFVSALQSEEPDEEPRT